MAKEEAKLETMQQFDEERLKSEIVKEASKKETTLTKQKAPEAKVNEEKPKATKEAAAGFQSIRYMGTNPSYTIGRHRFRRDDVLTVEKELAEYALTQSGFVEA